MKKSINTVHAVKRITRNNKWWAAINCGPVKTGGMTTGSFDFFSRNGISYKWYSEIFNPSDNLVDLQEIKTIEKTVCLITDGLSNPFEGFDDGVDQSYITIQNILNKVGINMSIDEIKNIF